MTGVGRWWNAAWLNNKPKHVKRSGSLLNDGRGICCRENRAERENKRRSSESFDSSVCSARSGHARCTVCIFTSQAFSWHRHPEQIMISERARELQSRDNILQPCNDPASGFLSSSRKNKAGRGSWWGGNDIKLSEINNSGFHVAFTCTSSFG